jgi:hypothetical protein
MGPAMSEAIEADYVVVGAGAVGLSFIDVLLDHTDAEIALVDRRPEPGGHWRDAYPFVRLHNVSALYGVNSRPLGQDRVETEGPDAGHMERARLPEILDYFDGVFREKLLASGRVRWLPRHEVRGAAAVDLGSGAVRTLRARRRIVDATFTDTHLPSTHGPGFPVAEGVSCVSPNRLPRVLGTAGAYTVIGAGKTAMDCVLYLLENGVEPDAVTWVRPRDPWLLNRRFWQPNTASFVTGIGGFAAEMEAAAAASSVSDFFLRLEVEGLVLRLDAAVEPTMFRCAIASEYEVGQFRRVRNVIRAGHVRSIERHAMILDAGEAPSGEDRIYVHCTADGVVKRPAEPIFQGARLVPQYVRRCAPVFAAALIARIEALPLSDAEKNDLCGTVSMVDEPADWLRGHLMEARNRARWSETPEIRAWLESSRLDAYTGLIARVAAQPTEAQREAIARYRRAARTGYASMQALLASD